MLYEEKDLPDIYKLKHLHDSDSDFVNYESKLYKITLSGNIFNNELMNIFILRLQKITSLMFDNVNIVKNFKNFMVDKYHYKHKN